MKFIKTLVYIVFVTLSIIIVVGLMPLLFVLGIVVMLMVLPIIVITSISKQKLEKEHEKEADKYFLKYKNKEIDENELLDELNKIYN